MKVIKDNEELKSYIIDGIIKFNCSIKCDFDIKVDADIDARDINAWNINAWNIDAWDINAWNINAWNINAWNIDAGDINAWNINAWDINAWDINAVNIKAWNINAWNIDAGDIDARNIDAWDISFYAFCVSYFSLKCKSIKGRRENSIFKCLDNEVEYKKDITIKIGNEEFNVSEETVNEIKKQLV